MITEAMIREGYAAGIVRVIDSPHGDGAACQIGEHWFYFWNEPDEMTAKELTSRYPADVIIREIWDGLERSKRELEFADEYDYYECILVEGLRIVNEILCPNGAGAQKENAPEGILGKDRKHAAGDSSGMGSK